MMVTASPAGRPPLQTEVVHVRPRRRLGHAVLPIVLTLLTSRRRIGQRCAGAGGAIAEPPDTRAIRVPFRCAITRADASIGTRGEVLRC